MNRAKISIFKANQWNRRPSAIECGSSTSSRKKETSSRECDSSRSTLVLFQTYRFEYKILFKHIIIITSSFDALSQLIAPTQPPSFNWRQPGGFASLCWSFRIRIPCKARPRPGPQILEYCRAGPSSRAICTIWQDSPLWMVPYAAICVKS